MSNLSFDDLKIAAAEVIPHLVGDDVAVPNAILALASATGNICEELSGIPSDELEESLMDPEILDRLADELALVGIHLQHVANLLGINLDGAIENRIERIRQS